MPLVMQVTSYGVALTITVNFVHVFRWNTNDATLLDNLWIFSDYGLDNLEIFHCDL
jgi:hypothetical protein